MDLHEALEFFRHPKTGVIDISSHYVAATMSRIRQEHGRALAASVERAMRPILDRYLPARQRGLPDSSYGTDLRVALLPHNFWFEEDVRAIRSLLAIPEGEIGPLTITISWSTTPIILRSERAGWWLGLHTDAALGRSPGNGDGDTQLVEDVPQRMIASATRSAELDWNIPDLPSWLSMEPSLVSLYQNLFNLRIPLDRIAARLIERHRLPWRSKNQLQFFILTLDQYFLEQISPFDVAVERAPDLPGRDHRVTVEGIDEFTTKEQWGEIWDMHLAPRLARLWEAKGKMESPHRRPDLERLREYLGLYKLVYKEGMSIEEAFEAWLESLEGEELERWENRVATTIARACDDIHAYLGPQ